MKCAWRHASQGCSKEEYDVEYKSWCGSSNERRLDALQTIEESANEQRAIGFERAAGVAQKSREADEVLRGRPELTGAFRSGRMILQPAAESEPLASTGQRWKVAEHFFCALRKSPASRARGGISFASNSIRSPPPPTAISASTSG